VEKSVFQVLIPSPFKNMAHVLLMCNFDQSCICVFVHLCICIWVTSEWWWMSE
jgi:hypothetical protein